MRKAIVSRFQKIVLSIVVVTLLSGLTVPTALAQCGVGGKVTGGGQCIVGENIEVPSASFGFNAIYFTARDVLKGELNYVDHLTGMHVHVHELTYLDVWWDLPGNKPYPLMKAAFGGPCTVTGEIEGEFFAKVYVEDRGEPGTADRFIIQIVDGSTVIYEGGSGDIDDKGAASVPILVGNIQIHKPPK